MKRTWTIIGVRDVPQSYKWYQTLFGQRATAPAHPDFGQLVDADGTVLLCLHEWSVEEHPSLMSPDNGTPGNGLLLFFRVDDYGKALRRARTLVPKLEEEPHTNPNTQTKEFSLRDPDGYFVSISALSAAEQNAGKKQSPAKQTSKKRLQPQKSRSSVKKPRGKGSGPRGRKIGR